MSTGLTRYDAACRAVAETRRFDEVKALRAIPSRRSPLDLAKQADAILKGACCDTVIAAKIDKHYRRQKRAESKLRRRWRAKRKKLGKFGAASPIREILPEAEWKSRSRNPPAPEVTT
jgi:hypothetical protein